MSLCWITLFCFSLMVIMVCHALPFQSTLHGKKHSSRSNYTKLSSRFTSHSNRWGSRLERSFKSWLLSGFERALSMEQRDFLSLADLSIVLPD